MVEAMNSNLSKDDIEAGLAYCRWLHMKRFNEWLNSAAPSLPKRTAPVLLNDHGKRVYEHARKQLPPPAGGAIRTCEAEREAIVKLLGELKIAHRCRAGAQRRTGVKHATLQLSSITKFVGSGKRTIRGLANSGLTDRVGDIVEPKGGQWTLPVPLLWQHKHDAPIGWVRQIEARSDGLWITAELAEGIGKADEAWKMIEAGLVDSYSIGFQGEDWEPLAGGGKRFKKWSLLEISVVTIPADARAKISRGGVSLTAAKRSGGLPLLRSAVPGHPGAVRLIRSTR